MNLDFKKKLQSIQLAWLLKAAALIIAIGIIAFVFLKAGPDKGSLVDEIKNACGQIATPDVSCYAKRMVAIAEGEGPRFAFDVLFALQKIDNNAINCHLISHGIGEGTYNRSPDSWQEDIRTINQSCGYGAMHGIMESYVATLPGGTLTESVIRDLCGGEFSQCNHILGHLLLVEAGAVVDEALELCRALEDIPRQVENCYNGIFMEYQTSENLIQHGLADASWMDWPSRMEELEAMCKRYDGLEGIACWRLFTHAIDITFNHDPVKIFTFCDRAQFEEAIRECKRNAIGILTAYGKYDYEKLKPMCHIPQPSDPNFTQDCYARLAVTTLSIFPERIEEVKQYCSGIPLKYQEHCFEQTQLFTDSRANTSL